ncbi:MAG: hypothetical protein MZV63_64605 [Marinilabiliales bacterium]|nr:hypothetical protein [Marinilabiliales bacterium]
MSSGTVGGPFTPSSQSYTLRNTGGSTIDWTAAKTQSWTSLFVVSGTLAPGASVTVDILINNVANSLAAGTYTDTLTITNTTNGTGNTTRPVSLTVATAGRSRGHTGRRPDLVGPPRGSVHAFEPSLHAPEHGRRVHQLDGRENPGLDDAVRLVRDPGRQGDGHGHGLDQYGGQRAGRRDLQRHGHVHQPDQRLRQHGPPRGADRQSRPRSLRPPGQPGRDLRRRDHDVRREQRGRGDR